MLALLIGATSLTPIFFALFSPVGYMSTLVFLTCRSIDGMVRIRSVASSVVGGSMLILVACSLLARTDVPRLLGAEASSTSGRSAAKRTIPISVNPTMA